MQSSVTLTEQLCKKCYKLFAESLSAALEFNYANVDHYELPADLQAAADTGCRGCQILWMHMVCCADQGGVTKYDSVVLKEFSLSKRDAKDVYLAFTMKWPSPLFSKSCGGDIRITLLGEQGTYREIPPILQLANESIDDEINTLLQTTTKHWIDNCSQNHEKCQQAQLLKKKIYAVPTRLIDVQSDDGNTVKLVDTREELADNAQPIYLILSYCWGIGNNAAKTTQSNLNQRKRQIIVRDLPRTIRDAIRVTRAMGVRYLWVDALCIIQPDNDGYLQDWKTEAAQMGNYYSNALLCISALCAGESSDGFLRERHSARYPWRAEEFIKHGDTFFSLQPPVGITKPDMQRMPLMKRAWVLQERILSTRRLHWSAVGLLWECDSGLFQENLPLSDLRYLYDSSFRGSFKDHLMSQILNSPKEEALGSLWLNIVEQYSKMDLTNQTDRLAAIHGVARRLSLQHKADYFGGIFSAYCSTALTWKCRRLGKAEPVRKGFPSWSWASAESPWFASIYSRKSPHRITHFAQCADPGQFPSLDQVTDFKDRYKRKLWLKAPLVSIKLEEDDPMLIYDSTWYSLSKRSEGPIWRGQKIEIAMDRKSNSPRPSTVTLLVCIGDYPEEREGMVPGIDVWYKGLVVERSEEDGSDAYVRLGYFNTIVPLWQSPLWQEEEDGSYLNDLETDVNLF